MPEPLSINNPKTCISERGVPIADAQEGDNQKIHC